ncbi:MAG: Txe/YoeB family addiction module toxin [Bacteroidota bacterium]|nr:Txe/YoeB family addiction module toxin [Bacteroidota bacterium]
MKISFSPKAWGHYTTWQMEDKSKIKKINHLLKEIQRSPFTGTGKPEPLKHRLSGRWSRKIDTEHRLVYQVLDDEIRIHSCRYHYDP